MCTLFYLTSPTPGPAPTLPIGHTIESSCALVFPSPKCHFFFHPKTTKSRLRFCYQQPPHFFAPQNTLRMVSSHHSIQTVTSMVLSVCLLPCDTPDHPLLLGFHSAATAPPGLDTPLTRQPHLLTHLSQSSSRPSGPVHSLAPCSRLSNPVPWL